MGVDADPGALEIARRGAADAGVEVAFVPGDAATPVERVGRVWVRLQVPGASGQGATPPGARPCRAAAGPALLGRESRGALGEDEIVPGGAGSALTSGAWGSTVAA